MMEAIEYTQIKNISYLRARDPSILAWNYSLSSVRTNLCNELESLGGDVKIQEADVNYVQVYLRIKECEKWDEFYEIQDDNTLICKVPEGAHCIRNLRDGSSVTKKFTFSKIFDPRSKQIHVFNGVIKEKVLRFINGYNCTLLTYGASGSGKTFTIVGTAAEPGIIPRALEYLFRSLPQQPEQPCIKPLAAGEVKYLTEPESKKESSIRQNFLKMCNNSFDCGEHTRTYRAMQQRLSDEPVAVIIDDISDVSLGIWVSFAEIYNEYVYDLLKPAPPRGQQKQKLRLGYSRGNSYIKDLTCISVSSGMEAYHILQYGLHNLKYAATPVNDHSSRSHCIFTIKLAQACHTKEGVGLSLFHFCDLAGSERLKNTHNVGERLKESNNINTSLLVLGRCIALVRESQQVKSNKPIPFRESKLTQLFQKALMGQEGIAMIVNINPTRKMFDESNHVLNFSAVAKDVVVEQLQIVRPPRRNRFSEYMERASDGASQSSHSTRQEIEELQQQVALLYSELQQQKLDAQEEKTYVINAYKKILAENQTYFENRCQDLQDLLVKCMRESYENPTEMPLDSSSEEDNVNNTERDPTRPPKRQKMSVISLDSSSEDDITAKSTETTCNSENDLVLLKTELEQLKSQLKVKEEEIQKLSSEKTQLGETLTDAKAAYLELDQLYQMEGKSLYAQLLKGQDEIAELTAYIEHRKFASKVSEDDDKENYKPIYS